MMLNKWKEKVPAAIAVLSSFLVIATTAALLLLSHSRTPLSGYNLIVIVIDALRKNHLGLYGYGERDTSPFLDSLASEGLVFDDAFSNSSYTNESVASLLTGLYPGRSGTSGWGGYPITGINNIGKLFSAAGYRTGFFSCNPAINVPGNAFAKGFFETDHLVPSWSELTGKHTSPDLSRRALKFVNGAPGEKFMMYIHYLDPHAPYSPDWKIYKKFGGTGNSPHRLALYEEVREGFSELVEDGFAPGDPRYENLVLRYDAEIAHTDESIKMLFDGLKALGVLDKTLVVITADHGEEFLDHGYMEHAWSLYNEVLGVPLLFWTQGRFTPRRYSGNVFLADLLPSLLSILGIKYEPAVFDGHSFLKWDKGAIKFIPAKGRPSIAELTIQHRNIMRSVIKDNWKYIAAQRVIPIKGRKKACQKVSSIETREKRGQPPLTDPWGDPVQEELYDLSSDPAEKKNMIPERENIADELRSILGSYREDCLELDFPSRTDRLSSMDREKKERLRSLGYL